MIRSGPIHPIQQRSEGPKTRGETLEDCSASNATGAQARAVATRTGAVAPFLPGRCQGSAPTPRSYRGELE
jgi:hypothetical protein